MSTEQDPKGVPPPDGSASASPDPASAVSHQQTVDDPYGYGYDPYARDESALPAPVPPAAVPALSPPAAPPPVPPAASAPPPSPAEEDDEDEDGMLRMSFLEHLEELRSRLIRVVLGLGAAFLFSMIFHRELWEFVRQPIIRALLANGQKPELSQFSPVDAIMVVWVYMPLLTSVFIASPWVLYQVWAFIAPGLYKRERKWAGPFVIVSASLFILGGIFAYFVAFPLGLDFLLGAGKSYGFQAVLAGDKYFDLFVNVMLGVGLLFEMPVLVFLLTLIGLVTPGFLLRNSRYAILIIVILAAFLTPTPDIFNLTIFAAPMILLYFVGIFGGWVLTLHRQGRKGMLRWLWLSALATVLLGIGALLAAVFKFGYHLSSSWPFLVR